MKKIFLSFTVIAMLCLAAQNTYSKSITNNSFNGGTRDDNKKKISIGASRASGEMHLRFTSDQAGKVSISIINASGEIVLQQTEQVSSRNNTIPLKNATQLMEGSYTVRLTMNNESYSTRFMIWK